jgi:hypothetical protein
MKTLDERFWAKVKKSPDGCWEWQGRINEYGYGIVWFNKNGYRYNERAHRVAWKLQYKREIGKGLFACHKCDNTKCVRPDHLFIGPAADNNRDKIQKGRDRNLKGSEHPMAKLTDAQVAHIRKVKSESTKRFWGAKDLAKEYGVHITAIFRVINRKCWK